MSWTIGSRAGSGDLIPPAPALRGLAMPPEPTLGIGRPHGQGCTGQGAQFSRCYAGSRHRRLQLARSRTLLGLPQLGISAC